MAEPKYVVVATIAPMGYNPVTHVYGPWSERRAKQRAEYLAHKPYASNVLVRKLEPDFDG